MVIPDDKKDKLLIHAVDSIEGQPDMVPETMVALSNANLVQLNQFMLSLLDSGSSDTLINKRALPQGVVPMKDHTKQFVTTQGTYESNEYIEVDKFYLPEFSKAQFFKNVKIYLFDSKETTYDIIVGRNILMTGGFCLDFSEKHTKWMDKAVPFKKLWIPQESYSDDDLPVGGTVP